MKPAQEFYSWYVVNCVFDVFLSYTAITLNIFNNPRIRKTPSLSKPLKTVLLCLAISDLGVGLTVQPLSVAVRAMELKQADNMQSNLLYNIRRIPCLDKRVLLCFIVPCGGFNYRQILGYPLLSQIQGTCDSQARCCCDDLHMGVKRNSFVNPVEDPGQYHIRCVWHSLSCLCINCNTLELQDLFHSTRPNKPNSRHGTHCTTSSTEW